MNRRKFLKLLGLSTAVGGVGSFFALKLVSKGSPSKPPATTVPMVNVDGTAEGWCPVARFTPIEDEHLWYERIPMDSEYFHKHFKVITRFSDTFDLDKPMKPRGINWYRPDA